MPGRPERRRPARRRTGGLAARLTLVVLLSLACQVIPTPPALNATPIRWATPKDARLTPVLPSSTPPPGAQPPAGGLVSPAPGDLQAFPSGFDQPFASIKLVHWPAGALAPQAEVSLPARAAQVVNPQVAAGLTLRQQTQLYQQGFLVLHSQEANFMQVRERVSLQYGQPYYLSVDAAGYALHLALAGLQQALERQELQRRLLALVQATLDELLANLPYTQGGPLEADTRLAAAYLGVAVRLLDPQAPLDPAIAEAVQAQVQQIMAEGGRQAIQLIPEQVEDFSAYHPRGYYAGDPALAGYYRATRWLGRVIFPLSSSPETPNPSKAPLMITLALRRASLPGGAAGQAATPAVQEWARLRQAITFFNGPDAIGGPLETADLMDQVYGRNATILSLGNNAQNESFQRLAAGLPTPQMIPGLPILSGSGQGLEGWRFLGQDFQLDEFILQALANPHASRDWPPERLPGGLDLLAALDAPAAQQALAARGYSPPADQRLQNAIRQQDDQAWAVTRQRAWLHVLAAQSSPRGEAYPASMRTPAWAVKDLNSALGAWAVLRQPAAGLPAGSLAAATATPGLLSPAAPAYVEPEPDAFYRLSRLANAAVEGIRQRGMQGVFSTTSDPQGLEALLQETLDLGDRLQRMGDIAAGELSGQMPGPDEWAAIQAPLGPAEARAANSPYRSGSLPGTAGIATLAISGRPTVQVATGGVDRLYVLIPFGEKTAIAQGATYSYYEFAPARNQPVDAVTWQLLLAHQPPAPLDWASGLYLSEGYPVDVLAFQVGDVYRVTLAAGRLNVRQQANRFAGVVRQLNAGDLLTITGGPEYAGQQTWWQVQVGSSGGSPATGWVVQEAAWYARAY